jgi:ABC-type sugar transport system ATPase subunit
MITAIEISGATRNYPAFQLGPIDLSVRKGEFFGIFGPPASGKSSILKMILGLLKLDKGRIVLDGADTRHMEVAGRQVAMVFQNLALFPHMTGRENIAFPLVERKADRAEIDDRLASVAKVLHVDHILHKLPAQMSGGERQRIALGRALIDDNRAILLDEPIAALDTRLREEMRIELKRLQRMNGQTFVYVSHDEEEVMAISDRVAILIDGRIAQTGTPSDIYNEPVSLAVARVVGSPPMNLFEGRVSDDGRHFESAGLRLPLPARSELSAGQPVTVGIRPEDIHAAVGGDDDQLIEVSSIEPLGGYSIVNARFAGRLVKIRAPGRVMRPDDFGPRVMFDQRKLHIFGADGRRV